MVGYLAQHALGRYDLPLPTADQPNLCFVARTSTTSRRRGRSTAPTSASTSPCTRWCTRRALGAVGARAARAALDRVRVRVRGRSHACSRPGSASSTPSDPSSFESLAEHPEALLGAMRTPRQDAIQERLQRAHHRARGLRRHGPRAASRSGSCRRSRRSTRRCSATGSSGARPSEFIESLLGLELDRDDYDAGRGVLPRRDRARRARRPQPALGPTRTCSRPPPSSTRRASGSRASTCRPTPPEDAGVA